MKSEPAGLWGGRVRCRLDAGRISHEWDAISSRKTIKNKRHLQKNVRCENAEADQCERSFPALAKDESETAFKPIFLESKTQVTDQRMLMAIRKNLRFSSASGVTLIELIAVVAVMALLAVVTGPFIKEAVVSGRQQKCAGNLRQIGVGIALYASDHDGELPGTTHTTSDFRKAWIYALKPYLGNVDEVRICPADPIGDERLKADGTSYILNSYVFVPRVGPFGEPLPGSMHNIRSIPYPARTLFAANISDEQGASVQNDHTHSEHWGGEEGATGNWEALLNDIQPDRFSSDPSEDHTNGSANYLFGDGHVESIPALEIKERLQRGDNIARPPTP